jgi:acyl carrier protein
LTEKKTKKERSIKVNSTLKEIVYRIYHKSGITNLEEFIFLNKYGTKSIDKSYVNVKLKELFSKYRIRVKGNVSTHTFRKTLGRRVVEVSNYSNESLVLLMELFGHSNMGITKRYLGITKDEIHILTSRGPVEPGPIRGDNVPAETPVQQNPLDREAIVEIVRGLLADILGIEPGEISEGQSFIEDLGAASMELIELVDKMEQEFAERSVGFRIADEDLEDLKTVRDAVDYVVDRVSGSS